MWPLIWEITHTFYCTTFGVRKGIILALVELLKIIQTHGLNPPQDMEVQIEDADGKRWITVKKITTAFIRALALDFEFQKRNRLFVVDELGWRNKYNIFLLSKDSNDEGVSQRQIYGTSIIDDLCDNDFLEKRPTKSRWGNQRAEFRLKLDFLPVSDFIVESVRLFLEGHDK